MHCLNNPIIINLCVFFQKTATFLEGAAWIKFFLTVAKFFFLEVLFKRGYSVKNFALRLVLWKFCVEGSGPSPCLHEYDACPSTHWHPNIMWMQRVIILSLNASPNTRLHYVSPIKWVHNFLVHNFDCSFFLHNFFVKKFLGHYFSCTHLSCPQFSCMLSSSEWRRSTISLERISLVQNFPLQNFLGKIFLCTELCLDIILLDKIFPYRIFSEQNFPGQNLTCTDFSLESFPGINFLYCIILTELFV